MSVALRGARTAASSTLRCSIRPILRASHKPLSLAPFPRSSPIRSLSVMLPRQSGAPAPPSAARGYDPEILDIANFVHNTAIDSDLAVRGPFLLPRSAHRMLSLIPPASFLSTRLVADSKDFDSENAQNSLGRLSREPSFPMAQRCPGRPSSSTRSMGLSTSAP